MASKIDKYSDTEFAEIVATSISCAECMRKMGYKCTSGNSSVATQKRIQKLGLSTEHWKAHEVDSMHAAREIPCDEYFIKGDIVRSTTSLKNKVLKNKIAEYKCAICGNTGEWNGQPLSLQLHHINGDRTDNRPENLQFLCPNCHSQTDSYAGKNANRYED